MIRILISLLLGTLFCSAEPSYHFTLSKSKVFVGEALTVTLALEQNSTQKITKQHREALALEGFKLTPLPDTKLQDNRWKYILIPQQAGSYTLPAQQIEIAHKDPHTYRNIWQTLRSPSPSLSVLPLPEGITVTGNYTLTSSIDDTQTEANKPLHLTITVQGRGSLSTMAPLHFPDTQALIFEGTPSVKNSLLEGQYQSIYTQHFSIVADKNFVLPSLQWHYLNSDTGLSETLTTSPYPITVTNPLQKGRVVKNTLLVLAGLLAGILLTLLFLIYRSRKKPRHPDLSTKIKKARSDKALYHLLLPYADRDEIAEVLKNLEENISGDASHRIKKSEIARKYF